MEVGTQGFARRVLLNRNDVDINFRSTTATPNYGTHSVGDGPWDGVSTGCFAGSSLGTIYAGNAASGYAGNLIDLQLAGTSKFKVDSTGALTITGTLTLPSQTQNFVFSAPSGSSGVPGFRALVSGDIPSLDTAKITTGTFALARLTGITTSELSASAGIVAGQIASVNPSTLTGSGTVPLAGLTGITTTQLSATAGITSGQIASIPNQNASIITAGTLATARGGTGVDSSAAANGTLLIGTGSGLSLATITAGTNITITNTSGHIQIDAATGGSASAAVSSESLIGALYSFT